MDCRKQQKEVYKGTPQIRCINRKSEHYLQIVDDRVCQGCPVCEEREKKKTPCHEKPILLTENPLTVFSPHEGYPPCPFRYEGDSSLECSITKLPITADICNRCDIETREHEATFGEKVKNYFGAVRQWVANGRPIRSDEEVDHLFKEHCGNGCDRYDPEKHGCKNCGCAVSTDSSPLKNKLAMATEHCPLGRF